MKFGLAIVLWLILAGIAVANGYFGNTVVAGQLGDCGAHVYKSVVLVAAVFLIAQLYAHQTQGTGWVSAALGAGLLWLGLTIIFEFALGHYVFGNPWETLVADYQIWKGRLWPLVLISDLMAPLVMGWRFNR